MVLRRASSNDVVVLRATSTLLPAASETCEALSRACPCGTFDLVGDIRSLILGIAQDASDGSFLLVPHDLLLSWTVISLTQSGRRSPCTAATLAAGRLL